MKNILLIGIGGVYNYGCEAIVRGTAATLRSAWPGARIAYASPRPADDRRRLEGADVEVVRRPLSRYTLANTLRKLLSLVGVRWSPRIDTLALLAGFDAVVSIGGDIYTLREDGALDAAVPKLGDAALRRGIRYVLWGASVGPFGANPGAERFFKAHLSRVSLIAAREPRTVAYLKSIGIVRNVRECVDPAFFVAPEISQASAMTGAALTIGVNLSPLSLGFAGVSPAEGIRRQAAAIDRLIERFDADVMLVPHVVCEFNEADDDLRYLAKVQAAISAGHRGRVELLGDDRGFIGVKRQLVRCDLVIAARMHCAINAVAACVPTLFLAYSQKARGMAELVYREHGLLLPVEEFADGAKLLDAVGAALARRHLIRGELVARMKELRHPSASPAVSALKELAS